MWYRVDFSAILGGIFGLILMLFVVAVFLFPLAVEQFLGLFLP